MWNYPQKCLSWLCHHLVFNFRPLDDFTFTFSFQRRPNGLSWRSEDLRERPGPSQLITNFRKTVSHNFYTHLIVCPSNFSMYLEQLITDPQSVSLYHPSWMSPLPSSSWASWPSPPPPITHLPSKATWYILNETMHNFNDWSISVNHDTM